MPVVSRLSTTPVRGTALHSPAIVTITGNGVPDNRRFHMVDAERRLLDGKQHGPLVRLTAEWDAGSGRLRLQFPHRPHVEGPTTELGEAVRTDFYGRGVDGRLVEGPWTAALSDFVGAEVHLVAVDRPGDAVDVHPVTLVSTATLEHLRDVTPGGDRLDHRRFRMLVEVDGVDVHEEDTWAGRRVRLGGATVRVVGPVPRCVVTNEDPDTGLVDVNTLEAIVRYRGELAADLSTPVAHLPDNGAVVLGMYATVEQSGEVAVGDRAELLTDVPADAGTGQHARPPNPTGVAMPRPTDHEVFELGDVVLQHGATLRGARLAYTTYGTLAEDRSNVIVHPTWYSAWHDANLWAMGPGKALDPERHFIVVPNQLNNGLSSSPSNTPPPYDGPNFPPVTFYDQVEVQHRLLTEKWGIESVELVLGSSMGAAQTYQWAVSHPEMVKRAAPIVGASVTSEHNQVFLKSLRATLTLDPAFQGGRYSPDALPTAGLRAFARIYAGWGLSQAFYWQREYRNLGFSSLEDFLVGFWEGFWLDQRDPNDLLAMLWTWEHGDVGQTPGFDGDTEAALRSIRCPLLAMPASTDLYFPPEDEEWASQFIPNGEVRVIPTVYGHFAGLGQHPADNDFIDRALEELLARPA